MERMNRLAALLEAEGLSCPPGFGEKLLAFEKQLLETNRVMNLTAITDPEEMLIKHYWDSIVPLTRGMIPAGSRVVDVGCGAGFPSLPLKLAAPELDLTLLDSLQKRLRFLDGVIESLGLEGIRTLHLRAEDAGRQAALRAGFDIAVARAVAELSRLAEYCLPLVKKGGALIAYKGAAAEEELLRAQNALSLLGGQVEELFSYTLPGGGERRAVILIRKVRETPGKYPRAPKQIKDRPL